MAIGRLGRAIIPSANTFVSVYTVPAGNVATLNILLTNSVGNSVKVRVAVSNQATTPTAAEYIEYDATLPGINGVLERGAIVCSAGETIFVSASIANAVAVRVNGYEETI